MLRPDSLDLECFSNLVEATMKIVAELHKIFDVIDVRKVYLSRKHIQDK